MNLNAPKQLTFIIAIVLFVLALIVQFAGILSVALPWLWIVAFIVLALGVILKDF